MGQGMKKYPKTERLRRGPLASRGGVVARFRCAASMQHEHEIVYLADLLIFHTRYRMMMHKLRQPVPSPNCNLLVTTGDMGVCLRACFCIVMTPGSTVRVTAVIRVEVVRVRM